MTLDGNVARLIMMVQSLNYYTSFFLFSAGVEALSFAFMILSTIDHRGNQFISLVICLFHEERDL